MTMYDVVYELADDGSWSAYAAGLPVCAIGQDTPEEAERQIRDAIAVHLQALVDEGQTVPEVITRLGTVEV